LKDGVLELEGIAEELSFYAPEKIQQIKFDLTYFKNKFIGFWFKREIGWREFLNERNGLLNTVVCRLTCLENTYLKD